VTLGFLLKMFKAKFVEHIEHSFDTLLAQAHATQKAAPRRKAAVKTAKKSGRKA